MTPTNLLPTLGTTATQEMPCAAGEEEEQEGIEGSEDKQEHTESDGEPTDAQGEEVSNTGDLPGVVLSDVDKLMDKVFGDHVHHNDGTHLDGGISSDTT